MLSLTFLAFPRGVRKLYSSGAQIPSYYQNPILERWEKRKNFFLPLSCFSKLDIISDPKLCDNLLEIFLGISNLCILMLLESCRVWVWYKLYNHLYENEQISQYALPFILDVFNHVGLHKVVKSKAKFCQKMQLSKDEWGCI